MGKLFKNQTYLPRGARTQLHIAETKVRKCNGTQDPLEGVTAELSLPALGFPGTIPSAGESSRPPYREAPQIWGAATLSPHNSSSSEPCHSAQATPLPAPGPGQGGL